MKILNSGDLSAKEVLLQLRIPQSIRPGVEDYSSFTKKHIDTIFPDVQNYKNYHLLSYSVGTILPKQEFVIKTFLLIKSSTLQTITDEVKSKDGIPLKIEMFVQFQYMLDYVIYQDNMSPISGKIAVRIFDTSIGTLKDIVARINKANEKEYFKKYKGVLKRLGFYLRFILFNKRYKISDKVALLAFDDCSIIRVRNTNYKLIEPKKLIMRQGKTDFANRLYINTDNTERFK